jgi:hypothetical protein
MVKREREKKVTGLPSPACEGWEPAGLGLASRYTLQPHHNLAAEAGLVGAAIPRGILTAWQEMIMYVVGGIRF